ncbi:MAG: PilZ domain-containing protein [Acidiferrobacterales bacterium]
MMEHRWHVRRPVASRASLNGTPFGPFRARICDYGVGGVRVETPVALISNLCVELVFTVEDHGIVQLFRVPALIVWASDNAAGLMFCEINPESFRAIPWGVEIERAS